MFTFKKVKRILNILITQPSHFGFYFFYFFKKVIKKIFIFFYRYNSKGLPNGIIRLILKKKSINITFCELKKEKILFFADKICSHFFNLLGSGDVFLGKKIQWYTDFKIGYHWAYIQSSKIKYGLGNGSDIKVPWELSRFYHLPILAYAYIYSRNKKYIDEIVAQIKDWIQLNKYGNGPNWMNAMEVAIRVVNWSITFDVLRDVFQEKKYENFIKKWLKSIDQHTYYIVSNLEYGPIISNHYLSDIVGLLYVSQYFPELSLSKKVEKIALRGLEECMRRQVYDDGVDFESSISYHRLVTELFGNAALLCKKRNIILSNIFLEKLKKMFMFVWNYTKPNGLAPQIGDNDNGRLHILDSETLDGNYLSHAHLLTLFERIFSNEELQVKKSILYPKAQIGILRSKDFYVIVDGGKNGQDTNGGHCHNDIGSFELNFQKMDFIIDTGTYAYTSDLVKRNIFRGTQMHNTVMIDGEEQNRIPSKDQGVFWMYDDAKPKITKWQTDEFLDIFEVEHYGYRRLANPVIHKRIFHFEKELEILTITDSFLGQGTHSFEWNFYLDPEVQIQTRDSYMLLTNKNVTLKFEYQNFLSSQINNTSISPSYGLLTKTKRITFFYKGITRDTNFTFSLYL